MAHVKKTKYNVWHLQGNIIEDVLHELECSETRHFEYWIRGTRNHQYKIRSYGNGGKTISLPVLRDGVDTLPELDGWYSQNDTTEQTRMKSLRYILAKAYYRLCCELIQISCMKKNQHDKSLYFAVGTGEDIYQHLVKCKEHRLNKKLPRKQKRKISKLNKFDILEI